MEPALAAAVTFACASAGGCRYVRLRGGRPLRGAAPEGLVPLDSLPPLRRGIIYPCCFAPPKGRRAEGATAV